MTTFLYLLLCLAGFAMLYYGADWLVAGASSLARSLGITPVVIGLTVVAFGTSAPELVVSVVSSVKGNSMIAVGNVVGSNICNIALVLGAAAVVRPITAHLSVIRRDIPIMLAISLLLLLLSMNATLGRLEGALLFGGVILYSVGNYYMARKAPEAGGGTAGLAAEAEEMARITSRPRQVLLILVGIGLVVAGAEMVVTSAVAIMTAIGVSEKFIGLTIVAFGTSLPELATSVVAAMRREMDISIGNLVGSNVFNILSVLGAAALIRPVRIPGGFFGSGLWFDYLVMLFISALPWWMMRGERAISRTNGATLLGCYLIYLIYLITAG